MKILSSRSCRSLTLFSLIAVLVFIGCQKEGKTSQNKKITVLTPVTFEKTIQAHHGHILIVNFFATWCEPCRKELPDIISLSKEYASKGVDVIGISLDKNGTRVLRSFLERLKFPYPIYLGNQALMDTLKIQAIPMTYFYDRKGTRVKTLLGIVGRKRLSSLIKALLKVPSS